MKKRFLVILIVLLSVSGFAQELNGFLGINFGKTKDDTSKIIESKGYTLIEDKDNNSTYLNPKGIFFGLPAQRIILSYSKDNLLVAETFIVDIDESMKDDVFTTFKTIQKTFNLQPQDMEENSNSMSFYFIAPNKNRFILSFLPKTAVFTFGYKNTEENFPKEKLQSSSLVGKLWDAKYLTLGYSLMLQEDNTFVFVASGGDIDGMASGTYTITDDTISFSTVSYKGKNVNLIFRQSESYKIESITANSFIMKNTNPLDDVFGRPITFNLK